MSERNLEITIIPRIDGDKIHVTMNEFYLIKRIMDSGNLILKSSIEEELARCSEVSMLLNVPYSLLIGKNWRVVVVHGLIGNQ